MNPMLDMLSPALILTLCYNKLKSISNINTHILGYKSLGCGSPGYDSCSWVLGCVPLPYLLLASWKLICLDWVLSTLTARSCSPASTGFAGFPLRTNLYPALSHCCLAWPLPFPNLHVEEPITSHPLLIRSRCFPLSMQPDDKYFRAASRQPFSPLASH